MKSLKTTKINNVSSNLEIKDIDIIEEIQGEIKKKYISDSYTSN